MKMRKLVPAACVMTVLSTAAFAFPILPPMTMDGSVVSPAAMTAQTAPQWTAIDHAYRSVPGHRTQATNPPVAAHAGATGAGSCAALETRFDRDLKRPTADRAHNVADAVALFHEDAAFCRQGNVHAGVIYLKGAVSTLLARHVV